MRPTWCEVRLDAIEHNVAVLRRKVGDAHLCAVVKADAYGHGAVPAANAALSGGADHLAVALVEEGVELRNSGVDAPILVLSEPPPSSMPTVVFNRLTPAVYTERGVQAAATAAAEVGRTLGVEVCVDTGMRRVGCEPGEVAGLLAMIDDSDSLELVGIWTHCAVADELDNDFTGTQLERFEAVRSAADAPLWHAGNSAVTLAHPTGHLDMVRAGIAVYGVSPAPELSDVSDDLNSALSLHSRVSFVKRVREGEGVPYGHRWHAPAERWLATVPIGYADGVRRDLGLRGGEVLIDGVRRPIVGVVTMDQLIVDLGDDDSVRIGDEVVLIGSQGDDEITATEIAGRLDTIAYEVLCAISRRIPRTYR